MKLMRNYRKTGLALVTSVGLYYAFTPREQHHFEASTPSSSSLSPQEFRSFKLVHVEPVTHNVNRFRFELSDPNETSGIFVCSCVLVKAEIDGKPVIRPYTPVTTPDEKGHFDLCVKVYPDGVMSKYIHGLKIGDKLDVKGPLAKYQYKPNTLKEVGLIAGGTGLTPCYQLIRKILDDPNDKTVVRLVYANTTEADIMLWSELDNLAKKHPDRFKLHYTISNLPVVNKNDKWLYSIGYVDGKMIDKYMPSPSLKDQIIIGVCGPPAFMKILSGEKKSPSEQGDLTGLLKEKGFSEKNVYKF
jgi:cytochrome-b5 reductase